MHKDINIFKAALIIIIISKNNHEENRNFLEVSGPKDCLYHPCF